jgi:hypothetical protein
MQHTAVPFFPAQQRCACTAVTDVQRIAPAACDLQPAAGNILQFRFFLRNDAGILVALFWLFACALSSFAYFVSVFLAKQQSAVYTGFVVFLVSFLVVVLVSFLSTLFKAFTCHAAAKAHGMRCTVCGALNAIVLHGLPVITLHLVLQAMQYPLAGSARPSSPSGCQTSCRCRGAHSVCKAANQLRLSFRVNIQPSI